ncbi:MAG: LruC domain-containing protein, partial [Owenweeksia sp.]
GGGGGGGGDADADGDGVADVDDAFPNDASRAFISEYPAKGVFATIAFEDLWPARGDYDFNDLVVDYHLKYVLNANNQVVDVDGDYYIRAVGGTLARGVGIHFPNISAAAVSSVSGQRIFGNVTVGGNGTEQGQTRAVVIINDDIEKVINRAGGTFYNSVKGEPVGQSDSINVIVTFSNPVNIAQASDFSVFMFKKAGRGQEIHLPDNQPTDLADQSLFGTVDDDTQPGSGRYYKGPRNLPWALELPQRFAYPNEKTDLVQTYLKFAAWAQSSGGSFTDWYEDKTGYRAAANLFE